MPPLGTNLGAPELRRFLRDFVRRRVNAQDVEDIVQNVLADAIASTKAPREEDELRRWLLQIARYKIADHHRRAGREVLAEPPEIEAPPSAVEARDLALWAEARVPVADATADTLRWMAREGEGEKLEHIAEDEHVAATTVRKRVSRMRRWLRERWREEALAVVGLGVLVMAVWYWLEPRPEDAVEVIALERLALPPAPKTLYDDVERARALRRDAAAVDRTSGDPWAISLGIQKLDEASRLDPIGDQTPETRALRDALEQARERLLRERDRRRPSGSSD